MKKRLPVLRNSSMCMHIHVYTYSPLTLFLFCNLHAIFAPLRKYSLVFGKFGAFHRIWDFFLCRTGLDLSLKFCSPLGTLQKCQSAMGMRITCIYETQSSVLFCIFVINQLGSLFRFYISPQLLQTETVMKGLLLSFVRECRKIQFT